MIVKNILFIGVLNFNIMKRIRAIFNFTNNTKTNTDRFVSQTNKIKALNMKAKEKNHQFTNSRLFKNRRHIKVNNHVVKRKFSTFSNLPEDPNILFMAFVIGFCYAIVKH